MLVNTLIDSRFVTQYVIYRLGLRGRGRPGFMSRWYFRFSVLFLTALAAGLAAWFLLRQISTVVVALVGSLVVLPLWCWLFGKSAERLLHISMYDCGSARQLEGECLIFEYYWGEGWTPEERLRATSSLRTACQWLEDKADWRGVTARFTYEDLAKDHGGGEPLDVLETKMSDKSELLAERALERVALRLMQPDNFAIVVHVREDGGGFALPAYNNLQSPRFTEVGFCSYLHPLVYAHEILHLFGAYDLYLDSRNVSKKLLSDADLQKDYKIAMCEIFRAEFSHNVMGASASDMLGEMGVSNLTAHAIGWTQPWSLRKEETARYFDCERRARDLLIDTAVDERWPEGG
jgi:hypothetical protein